jgi:methyl-accepting chemotaxis protein
VRYILSAIAGALAVLFAILFGKRSNIHDNGSGTDRIRDSLADSKDRASDINRQIVDTSGTVADITEHIGSASDSVDKAIGVVQSIRRRGATADPVAQTGPDRD